MRIARALSWFNNLILSFHSVSQNSKPTFGVKIRYTENGYFSILSRLESKKSRLTVVVVDRPVHILFFTPSDSCSSLSQPSIGHPCPMRHRHRVYDGPMIHRLHLVMQQSTTVVFINPFENCSILFKVKKE